MEGKGHYFLMLFVLCAVVFFALTLPFALEGRSLVWGIDGLYLYYTFFLEEGEWLRQIAASIMAGAPVFPMYSFDAGMGADLLTMASSCFNDPFNLVSAFCPPEYAEYAYVALIFVRFFLVGVTFSLYCFSRGKRKGPTMCGALCYMLSGYVLFWGIFRHPNFVNWAILLPLVFMGADKVFADRKPFLLILSMAGIFLFSVYFSYMTCLFLLAYCLIAYFAYPRERSVRDFFSLVVKIALCLVCSFAIVGFSSVPMVESLLSMGRVGIERSIPLFQLPDFYLGLASMLLGNVGVEGAGVLSQGVLPLGAVPVFFVACFIASRRLIPSAECKAWLLGFLLCMIGASVAYVGSVMNGFGYSSNRWEVILGFVGAYMTVVAVPAALRMDKRHLKAACGLVTFALVWAIAFFRFDKSGLTVLVATSSAASFAILGLGLLGIRLMRRRMKEGKRLRFFSAAPKKAWIVLVLLLTLANTSTYVAFYLCPWGSDYASQFVETGKALEKRKSLDLDAAIAEAGQEYRIDRTAVDGGWNASLANGYRGIDFFSSFYNQPLDDFRYSLEIADDSRSHRFDGTQGRMALDGILGAKYYVSTPRNEWKVPYGYKRIDAVDGSAADSERYLYESDSVLPLAFIYDSVVAQNDYDRLTAVERQELLTESVVLFDPVQAQGVQELATEVKDVDLSAGNGVRIVGDRILVSEPDGELRVKVDGARDCESYLCFNGLTFESINLSRTKALYDAESFDEAYRSTSNRTRFVPAKTSGVTVKAGGRSCWFEVATSSSPNYSGRENWSVNLGYSEDPVDEFTVVLAKPGIYYFDSIYAAFQLVEVVEQNIDELKSLGGVAVSLGINSMTFDVPSSDELEKSGQKDARYLFVSVPFSEGWSATVDGAPATVERANVGFMAVEVDGKAHQVVFRYVTPGLNVGLICTVVGVVSLCGIALFYRFKRRATLKKNFRRKDDRF